jgi:stigma-specific protein Stig1
MRYSRMILVGLASGALPGALALGACSDDDPASGAQYVGVAGGEGAARAPRKGAAGGEGVSCLYPEETFCNGECVELQRDAKNCGECGYTCPEPSQGCIDGVCAAAAVVKAVVCPYSFVVDQNKIYFASPVNHYLDQTANTFVRWVALPGGEKAASSPVFNNRKSEGNDLWLRSRTLARLGNILYSADLGGGPGTGVLYQGVPAESGLVDAYQFQRDEGVIETLAVADGFLVWSSFDLTKSHLFRARAETSEPKQELTQGATPGEAGQFGHITSLAFEGTGAEAVAYWINDSAADGGLWRRPSSPATAAPERLLPSTTLMALAVGPDGLYLLDKEAGIGKASRRGAGQTMSPVVPRDALGGKAQGLAVSDGWLYWLAFDAAEELLVLHRASLDGSRARAIAQASVFGGEYWDAPIGPSQILVEGDFVYFSYHGTLSGYTPTTDRRLPDVTGSDNGAIYRASR